MKFRLTPTNLRLLLMQMLRAALLLLVAVISISARPGSAGIENGIRSVSVQHGGNRISSCRGQNGVVVSKQLLEAGIEKFRKGEASLGGIFYCREAFPTLKKYALDPDSKLREAIAYYLRLYYSPAALQVLIQQIERYPSDGSAMPYAYASEHPCYIFRKIKTRSLTQALTARIKARGEDQNGNEIRLLGCLSARYPEARKFLEEMSQPPFAVHLSENDRRDQLNLLAYALAEAGAKEAEAKVLADIQAATATGNPAAIQAVLEKVKAFSNCRILQPLAQLILDKRPVSLDVAENGRIVKLQARVGDLAVSAFTGAFGTEVTGENDVEWRPHADAEVERIYQRVEKALMSGKFSICRSSK